MFSVMSVCLSIGGGVPCDQCGPLQICSLGKVSCRSSTERPSFFQYKYYLVKLFSIVFRQIIDIVMCNGTVV